MLLRLSWLFAAFSLVACDPGAVLSQDAPEFEAAWQLADDAATLTSGTYGPSADNAFVDVIDVHAEENWVLVQSGAEVWAYALEPMHEEVFYAHCAEERGVRQQRLRIVDDPSNPLADLLGVTASVELTVDPCADGSLTMWMGEERTELGLL